MGLADNVTIGRGRLRVPTPDVALGPLLDEVDLRGVAEGPEGWTALLDPSFEGGRDVSGDSGSDWRWPGRSTRSPAAPVRSCWTSRLRPSTCEQRPTWSSTISGCLRG
jgi:hypothetical protein